MKKIILWLLVLIPCFIKADGVTYEASIGDNYYSTLEEAYEAAHNSYVPNISTEEEFKNDIDRQLIKIIKY